MKVTDGTLLHTRKAAGADSNGTSPLTPNFNSVDLLGIPVANLSLSDSIAVIHKIIEARRPHQHCVINAGKVVLMHRDVTLRRIVERCKLINADGQSVVWALSALRRPIPERVTGIDLMEKLLEEGDRRGYRIYFLGATEDVLQRVLSHVRERFPKIAIAGSHHGYFADGDDGRIAAAIAAARADILFVAMGSPKKEYWIAKNIDRLGTPFCMGVGGSFDVIAGKAKRAPRWIQRCGMEWFFRFIQEPRRLWRRYWVDNFVFIYLVIASLFGLRSRLGKISPDDLQEKEIT